MNDLIEPTDYRLEFDQVREDLIRFGVPTNDSKWLAELMSGDDFLKQPHDLDSEYERVEILESLSQFAGECFLAFDRERNAALLLILFSWLGLRHDYSRARKAIQSMPESTTVPSWAKSFFITERRIDWAAGTLSVINTAHQNSDMRVNEAAVFEFLLSTEILNEETKALFLTRLMSTLDIQHILDVADHQGQYGGESRNHERIEHWLQFDLAAMLSAFFNRFKNTNDNQIGKLAFGLYIIIGRMFQELRTDTSRIELDAPKIVQVMVLYFNEIEVRQIRLPHDRWLKKALWKFIQPKHWFPFYGDFDGFALEDKKTKYTKEATTILGKIRSLITQNTKQKNTEEFDRDYYDSIWRFLLHSQKAWIVLKPLLIAFSTLKDQVVASDLRYWVEQAREPLPQSVWIWLPERIASTIHGLREEQNEDTKLINIRSSFAEYCLSRLKTKKNIEQNNKSKTQLANEDFIEPREIWRKAYIRAVSELRINPKGKGHHILFWVSQNDPHNDVRQAAGSAYKTLRHNPEWQEDLSPRRALFGAFWWLRQAHLINLGIEVDPNGAQRTRSKEITWTNKLEQ